MPYLLKLITKPQTERCWVGAPIEELGAAMQARYQLLETYSRLADGPKAIGIVDESGANAVRPIPVANWPALKSLLP